MTAVGKDRSALGASLFQSCAGAVGSALALLLVVPRLAGAAATLELYATFHSLGVIVTVGGSDDPDGDATAGVEYRTGGGSYRPGFPLSRISDNRFVGSLFWLEPGSVYDVRVTFTDPDGGPLEGTAIEASSSTRSEIGLPPAKNSYYVSPSGSGTACALGWPCSLATGIARAQAGDEVVLRGGVYYQGEIDLPRSGSAGAPILIRGYPAETAVLDGSDPTTFVWADEGGGVYRATVNVADPHVVLADGQRLFPYPTRAQLENLAWGVAGFYANGTSLFVRLAGMADPNAAAMVVSRYNYAFHVERSYIYFSDLTFRYYGQGRYAKAIMFFDGSDNLVQNSTFASNDVGIGLKYDSHRNVIQDNVFFDTIFGWPWDGVKAVGNVEDGGVYVYDPLSGRGNVVRRNIFHDDFDALHVCPWTAAATNELDVYENLIYNMGDDGMETDGECANVRIWRNTIHDTLMGISLAPVYTGPVYAIRNLIYRTGAGGGYGSAFKFNSGYGRSGPMYLIHNTADAVWPNQSALTIFAPGTWTSLYARNNVWSGTAYAIENYNTSQPLGLDYDDLHTTQAGRLVRWEGLPDPELATVAALRAATGQEGNGLDAEPGFTDAPGSDYTLALGSPLIDRGAVIAGIDDSGPFAYRGGAPDIGAFEVNCGDGVREAGEACDDGNLADCDGCDSNCTPSSTCGNRIACAPEQCDDGNRSDGDCCSGTCQLEGAGAACDDGNPCTVADECDGSGGCAGQAAPRIGCRVAASGATSLLIRDQGEPARARLTWSWRRGAETPLAAFGDPLGSTDYALCLFDETAGIPRLVLRAQAPAGGLCGGAPCWRALGLSGFNYYNPGLFPDGLRSMVLRAGPAGKAKVVVKGRGASLGLPALPLAQDPRVTVELSNSAGECWQGIYPSPAVNEAGQFKDRS